MAYSERHADMLRDDLGTGPGLDEKKMFGGLCFLLHGNMVCGVTRETLMYRVGKAAEADALAIAGVQPLSFTGRKMGGLVEIALDDATEARRTALTTMELAYAASLPPK